MRPTPDQRFDSKWAEAESGCHLWTAALDTWGYGSFWWERRQIGAHVYAWIRAHGPVPSGLQVDHRCRVRCCVNPLHLRLLTNRANVLAGAGITAVNARKTICANGHEFTPENTRRRLNGQRACRECDRRLWREANARRAR